MRKWIVWNVIGVILCIAGAVVISTTLFQAGFNPESFTNAEYYTRDLDVEETFTDVRISGDMEDVTFTLSKDGKCHVTLREEEKAVHQVGVKDGTLTITVLDEREWFEKIGFWTNGPKVTVALPEGNYGNVSIETQMGDVQLSDLRCENLIISGNTGDVTLENVIARNELSVKVGTGDIMFDESDAGSINVETNTGDVEGSLLTEKTFEAKTNVGSVNVPKGNGGKCKIKTNTGDVEIEIVEERGTRN